MIAALKSPIRFFSSSLLWASSMLASAGDSAFVAIEAIALPETAVITDVKTKKQTFFDFLAPIVSSVNRKIEAERAWLKVIEQEIRAGKSLTLWQQQLLSKLAVYYKVDHAVGSADFFHDMYRRVDTLPISLVLAQAANESAWGTSRFAVQGNNLFGQWCFVKGCGLVPAGRDANANYEVRVFASVADSVKSYFRNLNTHRQYQELRTIRSEFRTMQQPLDSTYLAWGLEGYSSRGVHYIRELINMIHQNRLQRRDQPAYYATKGITVALD